MSATVSPALLTLSQLIVAQPLQAENSCAHTPATATIGSYIFADSHSAPVPEQFQTDVLVATLFTVSEGKERTDTVHHTVLRIFVEAILDKSSNSADSRERLIGDPKPVFPLSIYNEHQTYLQMYNAFCLEHDSLRTRLAAINSRRDDELVFKNYTRQRAVGCKHYLRTCQVYCAACDDFYFCCHCHDEAVKGHRIQYVGPDCPIGKVWCVFCGAVTPKSSSCSSCGAIFASYYCSQCLLYCSAGRDMYPRGHCDICNACTVYTNTLPNVKDECQIHAPVYTGSDQLCQFCARPSSNVVPREERFFLMPCGSHYAHTNCYNRAIASCSYTCPTCNKLIMYATMRAELEVRLRELFEITKRPISTESMQLASYLCYECDTKFVDQPHIVPLRCWNPDCLSFNTVLITDEMTSNMRRQAFEAQKRLFREKKISILGFSLERAIIRAVHNYAQKHDASIRAKLNVGPDVRLGERHILSYICQTDPSILQDVGTRDDLLERLKQL